MIFPSTAVSGNLINPDLAGDKHSLDRTKLKCLLIFLCFISNISSGLAQDDQEHHSGSKLNSRIIHFAGCDWYVRGGFGGPGPNYWSDSDESVWLDDDGRLHLRIRYEGARWYCAEVYTTKYTTYGEHRFLIEGDPELFDKNVVLGLFTYANDEAEIDIEFSRWGNANYQQIGSFTVQPYTIANNSKQFAIGEDLVESTHYF